MEKLDIQNDIKVFGLRVTSFSNGIGEAFDELIKKTKDCAGERNYYGICEFKNGEMFYYATAEEKMPGEAENYNYETFNIKSGKYLSETVNDWRSKTNCIKDVFGEILKDELADNKTPAIEWYKNDKEMMCMIKTINQQLK